MLIGGIIGAIQSLKDYLENPTFTNLGKFIQNIGIAIIGLALIIGNLPLAVIGAIVLIWGTIVKYWEQIKAFFQSGIDWLTGKSDWVREMFGDTIGDIYDNFVAGLQDILDWFDMVFKGIKANFDEFIAFFKNIFAGDWKAAWQNVKNIFGNIWNSIVNTVKTMANIISKIAINIGKTVGSTISGAFKAIVNGVMWAIENTLNAPIRAVNGLIDKVNQVPGINLGRINTFSLPRLAKGGIIAQPTTAVIGEAGREAIVPLENNTEGLELIADKIASKMGGNGIVNVYLDGKLIQRQMTKRSRQLAFARNGR
ncbi:MAG: phage tail tape measure protein [Clostridia bacterium]|jgi:phage-related protein|nr:phage tail tape measure protein [Clostridia bacterium]